MCTMFSLIMRHLCPFLRFRLKEARIHKRKNGSLLPTVFKILQEIWQHIYLVKILKRKLPADVAERVNYTNLQKDSLADDNTRSVFFRYCS